MKKNRFDGLHINIFLFCLIIFQSIGVRFFSGQGTLISIAIIVLCLKNLKAITFRDLQFLFFCTVFLLISMIINPSFTFSRLLYQVSLITSTYLFLIGYRNKGRFFQYDFFQALQIFVFHAIIGYCFYIFIPDSFVRINSLNKSLFNLFYVSESNFGFFQRNTGLFWEPGTFQLAANLFLFYCIKFNRSIVKILLAVLAVISSFSTSGLIILLINVAYFFYCKWKGKKIKLINILLVLFAMIVFIPIITSNTKDKINEDNTSGIVRLRDYYVGFDLIKEKPFIGHGVFDSQYLASKPYAKKMESNLFSNEYLEISGDMGGGYTNGFLGLLAWYGLPVGFLLYFFYLKNKFVDNDSIERILFNLIMLISLLSEPISYTSLFLMFPFSYWIFNQKKSIQRIPRNFTSANYFTKNQII